MFLPSLAEQNVPSFLGGTERTFFPWRNRTYLLSLAEQCHVIPVGGCVSVVPIGPRVVRWYKAATGDSWIVTIML
jgi:hypothetical protein